MHIDFTLGASVGPYDEKSPYYRCDSPSADANYDHHVERSIFTGLSSLPFNEKYSKEKKKTVVVDEVYLFMSWKNFFHIK